MVTENRIIGGVIHENGKLQWFDTEMNTEEIVKVSFKSLRKRNVFVVYPWLAYTGLLPDNRELVFANLADEDCPQIILHIDGQFVCFFGYDERNKLEYLNLEGDGKFSSRRI